VTTVRHWLLSLDLCRTVVKHEAFAVRKSSDRSSQLPIDEDLVGAPDGFAWTDERAERYEQLRIGAEAMAGLKPQEIRCLLLRAEGLSYQEICEATGFSYTKVNRCLTEGRRSFLKRVAGIESGAECQRLAPLISKVADGEASTAEMRTVRPHLKSCLACKATLREYRAMPSRVAGLVPPVVALAGGGGGGGLGFFARLLARFGDVQDAVGAKAAAIAASAVVVAGGGAAGVASLRDEPHPPLPAAGVVATPTQTTPAPAASNTPAITTTRTSTSSMPTTVDATKNPPQPVVDPQPAPTQPKPASSAPEFDPGTASGSGSGSTADPAPAEFASTPAAAPPSPATTTQPRHSSAGGGGSGSGSSTAEFGP
jgi:hypothetical protein